MQEKIIWGSLDSGNQQVIRFLQEIWALRMGEEKQFGVMNGKPEPEISAAGKTHGWTKSDFTSNGNLVRINSFDRTCRRFNESLCVEDMFV